MTYTEADFEDLSWHDCHVWGIALRAGDATDLVSQIVFDIDFILEWICEPQGQPCRFKVAPASLVFDEVTDLRIHADWAGSGFEASVSPASILSIDRECIPDRMVYPARPYYRWQIKFSWPAGGEIIFKAVGFTQTLAGEPVISETQYLTCRQRAGG